MIYPVKIYGKYGQLIRVVSSEEQLQKIWGDIEPLAQTITAEDKAGNEKKAITITCKMCGTVTAKFSFTAKFCSHQCAAKAQNNKQKSRRDERRKPRPCRKCGKLFKSQGNRQYCNAPCFSEFTAKRRGYIGTKLF